MVSVISYKDMTLDEAKKQLGGLTLGTPKEIEDASPKGTILEQSIKAGTEVEEGTEIIFTVSAGEPEDVSGSKTMTFNLPEGEGTVDVQVLVDSEVQYSDTVDKSLGSVTYTLTGTGTQQVTVKFDGVVTYQESVNFAS